MLPGRNSNCMLEGDDCEKTKTTRKGTRREERGVKRDRKGNPVHKQHMTHSTADSSSTDIAAAATNRLTLMVGFWTTDVMKIGER